MLRLLFDYVQNDTATLDLLTYTTILVIPILNVDGYQAISDYFTKYGNFTYIRKNRHSYSTQTTACPLGLQGVDLDRNYGYAFAYDDLGSSGQSSVCADDYRGPSAFSEPETLAMKNFLSSWPNIFIALNLHSAGNMLKYPFNYDVAANTLLKTNFPTAYQFYIQFANEAGLPLENKSGNDATLTSYPSNGGATDYMLGSLGIYAMSPFIGTSDVKTSTHFITNSSVLIPML